MSAGNSLDSVPQQLCPSGPARLPKRELRQIEKVQRLPPFRQHFSVRKIWRMACKRIQTGKKRKLKLVSWWKSGILLINQQRVPICFKPVAQRLPVDQPYQFHSSMIDLMDKHCRMQVNRVLSRLGKKKVMTPDVGEQIMAIENDTESKKTQLDLQFKEMNSKISQPCIPPPLYDELTNSIFEDPVITPEGYTYERHAIEDHLNHVERADPFTMTPLEPSDLIPNVAIQDAVDECVDDNEWAMDADSNDMKFFQYD